MDIELEEAENIEHIVHIFEHFHPFSKGRNNYFSEEDYFPVRDCRKEVDPRLYYVCSNFDFTREPIPFYYHNPVVECNYKQSFDYLLEELKTGAKTSKLKISVKIVLDTHDDGEGFTDLVNKLYKIQTEYGFTRPSFDLYISKLWKFGTPQTINYPPNYNKLKIEKLEVTHEFLGEKKYKLEPTQVTVVSNKKIY